MVELYKRNIVCLILLLPMCISGNSENEDKVIVISDRVGDIIDLSERNYFNFLPAIKGYKSARFLKLSEEEYVIEVAYIKDGEEEVMRIFQNNEDIEKIRYHIEHYEEKIQLTKFRVEELKAPKSKTAGVVWSIGATIIPPALGRLLDWSDEGRNDWRTPVGWILTIGGPVIGPSAGHFYAEQWRHGLNTMSARLGIGLGGCLHTILLGALIVEGMEDYNDIMIAMIPTGIACLAIVGHGIYDIATVPGSVQKYNEKLEVRPEINFKDQQFGVGVVYRF